MRFLSLFAGIGGFDLGLERTGMECVGQVENDPFCIRVLEKHWPNAKRLADIRGVKGDEFGPVDLICGGFPCQPWSGAGKRRGTEDDRDLWPEMLRIIEIVRPRWVIGENVRGFVSMEMGLDRSISDLENIGYAVQAFIVPACAVDAPHRRDRCWIVANAQRERGPGGVLHGGDKLQTRPGGAADTPGAGGKGREAVAVAKGAKARSRYGEVQAGARPEGSKRLGDSSPHVADNEGDRLQGREKTRNPCRQGASTIKQPLRHNASGGEQWLPEPPVGRVAHGIPQRVDRLKCLGNAVVPQVVERIGCAILEAEGIM